MVDRHDPEPHAELGRAGPGQLLGMKFGPHPEPPAPRTDSLACSTVKNPRSQNTSRTRPPRPPRAACSARSRRRDHRPRPPRAGRRARRETCGPPDPHPFGCGPDDPQAAQLIGEREPVARLRLDGRGAGVERRGEPLLDERLKQVVRRRPGRGHRAQDAAGLVRLTRQPGRRLVGTVAANTGWVCASTRPASRARCRGPPSGRWPARRPATRPTPLDRCARRRRREGGRWLGGVDLGHQQPPGPGQQQRLVGHRANDSRPSRALGRLGDRRLPPRGARAVARTTPPTTSPTPSSWSATATRRG